MPKRNSNAGRIRLPEVFSPDGYRCVKLLIPDDDSHHHLMLRVLERYLTTQTYLERDNSREGAKLVSEAWRNALYLSKYDNNCGESESICTSFFPLTSGLFEFFPPEINETPDDPQWVGPVWQTGTQYGNQAIWQQPFVASDILALWPLSINPLQWVQGIDTGLLPRVQIRVFGSGTLEVHYLKVFQGGAALTVINGDFQSSTFNVLQLGSIGNVMQDILAAIDSVLTEDADPVDIAEYELVGEQEHVIDIYFLPFIDVDNPFDPTAILGSGVGGGIRKIEFCGEQQLTEFRQNPADPCILEYRGNPSAEWQLAFDYSLCQPETTGGDTINTTVLPDLILGNTYLNSGFGPNSLPDVNGDADSDTAFCWAIEQIIRGTLTAHAANLEERRNAADLGLIIGAVVGTAFITAIAGPAAGLVAALGFVVADVQQNAYQDLTPEGIRDWLEDRERVQELVCAWYEAVEGRRASILQMRLGVVQWQTESPLELDIRQFITSEIIQNGVELTIYKFAEQGKVLAELGLIENTCGCEDPFCIEWDLTGIGAGADIEDWTIVQGGHPGGETGGVDASDVIIEIDLGVSVILNNVTVNIAGIEGNSPAVITISDITTGVASALAQGSRGDGSHDFDAGGFSGIQIIRIQSTRDFNHGIIGVGINGRADTAPSVGNACT